MGQEPKSPPRIWTSLELINWTKNYFEKKGIPSARLEAELLLADVLHCPRIRLYVDFEKPVPPEKLAVYRDYVKRRGENREPSQYILGSAQFLDLTLKVNRCVMIPRPETELLAAWALERVNKDDGGRDFSTRVLDLCTGSGCLALYLAAKNSRVEVRATDVSADALAVAAENARALNLSSRVVFHCGDFFEALPAENRGTFDLLVANPPYIDPGLRKTLAPEVRQHEPPEALFAEDKGLSALKKIIAGAAEWLKPGAWLGLEFGLGQDEFAGRFAEENGQYENVEIRKDDAKLPRFITAMKKRSP